MSISTKSFSASKARQNLYEIVRKAASGLSVYEINLRGSDPVVLISKAELDGWLETLDILSNKPEADAIRAARREKGLIPHSELLKQLDQ